MLTKPTPKGAPPHEINTQSKTKGKKNTAAGCGCVCGAAGVCPPWPQENKTRGKKCVLRPTGPRRTPTRHGSLSAPFVAAPPHACSRRGTQGRHERVGGCASGAVGREHPAPLAGRVQQQTKGKSKNKEKTPMVVAPKKQKKQGDGEVKDKSKKTEKFRHIKPLKMKKKVHSGCPNAASKKRGRERKKRKHKKRKELRRVIHYRMCVGVRESASVPH
ncbi:hypothetical protein TCSYLVIO_005406 [Trypanosoma cruzi]|nr:hypothetical protein TCSYLVIO_005406 [Trypanosoma cruzi]